MINLGAGVKPALTRDLAMIFAVCRVRFRGDEIM